MASRFNSELRKIPKTIEWASHVDVSVLSAFISDSRELSLIPVGSGGSLTAAHFCAMMHQAGGMASKAMTPMDLWFCREVVRKSACLVISARGKNPDIVAALECAALLEPPKLMTLSMRADSPLGRVAERYPHASFVSYDAPFGKDGYLATNSLVAFIAMIIRAYADSRIIGVSDSAAELSNLDSTVSKQQTWSLPVLQRPNWTILYGGWGFPAAVDIESKLTEAAIADSHIADYRNFAHGRHNWLAKRNHESVVIALITPYDREISRRTLAMLPDKSNVITIETKHDGPIGGLDLVLKAFCLIDSAAEARCLDPARPGVEVFGRRLYHMNLADVACANPIQPSGNISEIEDAAIRRKRKCTSVQDLGNVELQRWLKTCREYMKKIEGTRYGGIVLDYDGTICSADERFTGPSPQIVDRLAELLNANVVVGIATGRGKSVRIDLQKVILHQHWNQMLIGYYNGGDISDLSDTNSPRTKGPEDPLIAEAARRLTGLEFQNANLEFDVRPRQISIMLDPKRDTGRLKKMIMEAMCQETSRDLKVLESTHSIDIVPASVTKVDVARACSKAAVKKGLPSEILCIGDMGQWPGNDYELLSSPHSLSSGGVSSDPRSCWNFSRPGVTGIRATLAYLEGIDTDSEGMRITLQKKLEEPS